MSTTIAYDAISGNVSTMPRGQHCGYVTGTGIAWSNAQFVNDPAAVRIDQSPVNTVLDETADVLDVEGGAATVADIPGWVKAASVNFAKAARPGQRRPMIYCSQSTVDSAVNALKAAGLGNVPFWVAKPGQALSVAQADIANSTGSYPLWGVQYQWNKTYDDDVFLASWLTDVSGKAGDTVYAGDYGPAVQAAQQRLNVWAVEAKLAVLVVDGEFGPKTLVAVQAFQKFKGLPADGVVGKETWTALDESPVPVPPPSVDYGPPVDLKLTGRGAVPVTFTWGPPGTAGLPAPDHYDVYLYKGTITDKVTLLPGYPCKVTAASYNTALADGVEYTLHVVAAGPGETDVKPMVFAKLTFTV